MNPCIGCTDSVEAKTRVVEFRDVKPDDFIRFLEYAYRHDYTVPPYTEDEDLQPPAPKPPVPPEPKPEPVTAYIEDEPVIWTTPVTRVMQKSKPTLRSSFDKRNYLSTGDPKAGMLQSFEPQYNSSSRPNFTPVLLAHARLYTFADMRLIQPLRSLTLHKLHITLKDFRLYDQRVDDVLELARYAYEHGLDRTSDETIDDLRNLVVQYIACELDQRVHQPSQVNYIA
ncbi:hypothetical protein DM02DRAFT_678817 [Periconia macrospinosa]|uniref:BTB domain-containing protein n=1 Tax=Periconia macrospinosa TaxID=97972 RepID=A0A2V1CWG8_9PLEO|nr:hypothetical protein DM02DRAFT_678817 [Periconia macrospinosa]